MIRISRLGKLLLLCFAPLSRDAAPAMVSAKLAVSGGMLKAAQWIPCTSWRTRIIHNETDAFRGRRIGCGFVDEEGGRHGFGKTLIRFCVRLLSRPK